MKSVILPTSLRAAAAALLLGVFAGLPVLAQPSRAPAEVTLIAGDSPYSATILGPVRAEIHQKSMMPKKSNRELADEDLRRQAARMGADAVVKVVYETYNPATSTRGFIATGVAVKFTAQQQPAPTLAAAPAPQLAAAPAPAPQVAAAPVRSGPVPAAMIPLASDDIYGGRYQRLGEVKAEAHQTSMLPRKSTRDVLDESLRAQAARLGADAVVLVKYDMNGSLFSKKGSFATGVAVKLGGQPGVTTPPPLNVAGVPPTLQPIAAPALPVPAVRTGPTPASLIVLTEQDLAGRPHVRLGDLKAEAHQTSMFPKKGAREMLDESFRAQAARLGADAVVLIKYDMNGSLFSKKGSFATGVAIRFGDALVAPPPAPTPIAAAQPAGAPQPLAAAPAPAPALSSVLLDGILLSEADANRPYAIVGQLNAMATQSPARDFLNASLRAQAAGLGADAVVQIRYDLVNSGVASRPSHATGVAVKYR